MSQQMLIADEAWSKIPPAVLKQYGYLGVVLYVSRDPGKCGTRADVDALHGGGLGATWVFEDTAQRALGGYQTGVADGQFALSYLQGVGMPKGLPVYAAVDFAATPAQMPAVLAYLDGFTHGLAGYYQARAYGDAAVVDAMVAHGIPDDWQACAWSNGVVDGKAALYQRLKPTTGMPGSYDEDVVLGSLDSVGLWMPDPPTPLAPAPIPATTKRYRMLVYAEGLDATTALAVCAARRVGVATTDLQEAKDAIARGEQVIVIGGPAARNLGLTAPVNTPTVNGAVTVAIGQTAGDTLTLAAQVIK